MKQKHVSGCVWALINEKECKWLVVVGYVGRGVSSCQIIHSEPHSATRKCVIDSWLKTVVRAGSRVFNGNATLSAHDTTEIFWKTIAVALYPTLHCAAAADSIKQNFTLSKFVKPFQYNTLTTGPFYIVGKSLSENSGSKFSGSRWNICARVNSDSFVFFINFVFCDKCGAAIVLPHRYISGHERHQQ